MKISVALAYYNGGEYIKEQMDSILDQLGPSDELIISIDSAEDGSMDYLTKRAQADGRIRLTKGPGKGVVANFEHAISLCSGQVIFLSDQDDIWEKGKVETVMKAFEKGDYLAVLHNASLVDAKGVKNGESDLFTLRKSRTGILKNLILNSYVGCCMAFRRELLPVILPIPDKMYMHDYWIGTAAELCGRVGLIKRPLIRYRRHESNVTEMTHGSLGFMIRKRLGILYCLIILIKRRRRIWKGKQKQNLISD